MKQHYVAERQLAAIGAARHGIVPTSLAVAVGIPEITLARFRRRGLLIPIGRGVDRLRDHPFTRPAQCRAALDMAGPGAVVGLRAAARLLGFYAYRHVDDLEVVIARGRDQRTTIGRIVQTRVPPLPEQVVIVDGLPVTSAARTFFDLCGDPDGRMRVDHPAHERKMRRVYNDALARRGLTFAAEVLVFVTLARRGRSGTRLVRRILKQFGEKHVPTQSETETLFFELVLAADLPEPDRQVTLSDERGFIGVVDFYWPKARHVVEIDSSWHDGPIDKEEDAERDARVEATQRTVARYRWDDLVGRPDEVLHELGVVVGDGDTQLHPVGGGAEAGPGKA